MTPSRLHVHTPQGFAGDLVRDDAYNFTYDLNAQADTAVSLTMPPRPRSYVHASLHPVFQMNLPEGFLLERLRQQLSKTTGTDPMLLLALLGGDASIGRLRFQSPQVSHAAASGASIGERLSDILAYQGAQGLFDSLIDRYLMRSGLSGIQPKVLVPEIPVAKATMLTSELIVKSGLDDFPGLAINEFICMTIVGRCGVPTPEMFLSNDRHLFVMRRFDRTAHGQALGFEDMAVLAAKNADQKYDGSYEHIAKLVAAFASPRHIKTSLTQLFDMVALSCLLGNGDAHLKNFGLLYDDADNVKLAPAFDIVNTTCYIPQDNLALALGGNRTLFASRQGLLDFAPRCNITAAQARKRIQHMIDVTHEVMREHAELIGEVPNLREALSKGLTQFGQSFGDVAR
jgi:serine/threonine-protein kinase HipA